MYAAVYLDDYRAFSARKGDDGVEVDGVNHLPIDMLLRLHVCADLVRNQQTRHKSVHGNY